MWKKNYTKKVAVMLLVFIVCCVLFERYCISQEENIHCFICICHGLLQKKEHMLIFLFSLFWGQRVGRGVLLTFACTEIFFVLL